MSWIEVMWIIGLVITCILLYALYRDRKTNTFGESVVCFGIILTIIIICCCLMHLFAYNNAIYIPYEYEALIKNVDDMEEYLMKYDNISNDGFGSIGQGLESLEYKQNLQEAIKDRNEEHADICSMLSNFWTPYKDLIISNLPPGTYGRITVSE